MSRSHVGQGDHSPDNMKFPDGLLHSCLCIKCYSYHAGIVSGGSRNATVHESKTKRNAQAQQSRMDANMQLTINSFRLFFPEKIFSLTFP